MPKSKIMELLMMDEGSLTKRQREKISKAREDVLKEVEVRGTLNDATFGCCSQATLLACQETLGLEDELAYKAATFFGGGMCRTGNTCGALIGGIMALGLVYGRGDPRFGGAHDGDGTALKLLKWFDEQYGSLYCIDLLEGYVYDPDPVKREEFMKSDLHQKCFKRCGKVAAKVIEFVLMQGADMVSFDAALKEDPSLLDYLKAWAPRKP